MEGSTKNNRKPDTYGCLVCFDMSFKPLKVRSAVVLEISITVVFPLCHFAAELDSK